METDPPDAPPSIIMQSFGASFSEQRVRFGPRVARLAEVDSTDGREEHDARRVVVTIERFATVIVLTCGGRSPDREEAAHLMAIAGSLDDLAAALATRVEWPRFPPDARPTIDRAIESARRRLAEDDGWGLTPRQT